MGIKKEEKKNKKQKQVGGELALKMENILQM